MHGPRPPRWPARACASNHDSSVSAAGARCHEYIYSTLARGAHHVFSAPDLRDFISYAARRHAKVIITGDPDQLAAVENGGGLALLANQLGYVQLTEAVRFTAEWERAASLRLRAGDATAIDDYQQHGRISGAAPEQAIAEAVRAHTAPCS